MMNQKLLQDVHRSTENMANQNLSYNAESQSQTLSMKNKMNALIGNWGIMRSGKKIANYHNQIEEILAEVNYDVGQMNRQIFEVIRTRHQWSERHVWPLTAWNDFCRYGMAVSSEFFPATCLIEKHKNIVDNKLPGKIKQEIQSIIDAHVVHSTAAKLKKESQEHILSSFEAFRHFIIQKEPNRNVESLGDFTENDALNFKDVLLKTEQSPLTGRKVSFNTLSSFLIDLRRIFKMGVDQKKVATNIFKEIKIEKQKIAKREFCLMKEQMEELRSISNNKLDEMSLLERFEQIRNNVMISAQYEPALRAEEVVNLCWEDISQFGRVESNVGPVIVRGAKARPDNHEDRVYILLDRIDADLYQWKRISEEYCAAHKIIPPQVEKNGKTYHPIFFSRYGKTLNPEIYISGIFAGQLRKTGIILPKGYKTHILRHSRITHWVDDGYPFEKVHENARHSNLEETWKYFHSNAKKRIEAVERVEKLDMANRTLKTGLLPDKGILRTMIQTIVDYLRENSTLSNSDQSFSAQYYAVEKLLRTKCEDYAEQNLYYTFREVVDKWNLGRTQTYERIKTLTKQGLLLPINGESKKQKYLKEQIDYISSLIDSKKASAIFGYHEKVPTTIPALANRGIVKSTKIGKLHYFEPTELLEHFYEKNSKS